MALKKLKWLKYLFVNRTEAETEQNYWNEKRKKHLANEHSEGIVVGLEVSETDPPSLKIKIQGGRAVDTAGNDPEVESAQEIDLTSLVPGSGTQTVYIILRYNEVETEPYFVDEIGEYQNKYIQDSSVLEAKTVPPVSPEIELARIVLQAGATSINNAVDPKNPGVNEIDLRHREYTGKEVIKFKDLSDIDENEADAFNTMNNPSASNPIATFQDIDDKMQPVKNEIEDARGSKSNLDARLDVMLNEDGTLKPGVRADILEEGVEKVTDPAKLNFGPAFDVTDGGEGQANVNLDLTEVPVERHQIKILKPQANSPADNKVYVNAGRYVKSDSTGSVDFAGGQSPVFNPVTADSRIDLLCITDAGTLVIVEGTQAVSPVVPAYPSDKQVIAEVTITELVTVNIVDVDIRDVRVFLNLGGGGVVEHYEKYVVGTPSGNYTGSQTVFDLKTGSTYIANGANLQVYKNGQKMVPGASDDYLETDANTVTFNVAQPIGAKIEFIWKLSAATVTALNEYRESYIVGTPKDSYSGSTTVFDLVNNFMLGGKNLQVFYDGTLVEFGVAYVETDTNTVTFLSALTVGHRVDFVWKVGSSAGNTQYVNGIPASASPLPNTLLALDGNDKFPASILRGNPAQNILINGGMEIWQRNSSFTNPANNSYTADRWRVFKSSTGNMPQFTISREGGPAGLPDTQYAMKVNITDAGTGTRWIAIQQVIENYPEYKGKKVTVSAWIYATVPGVIKMVLADSVAGAGSAFHGGTGWEKLTVTHLVNVVTASLVLYLLYMEAPAIMTFWIDNVMMNVGEDAADYVCIDPQKELARCQRYYGKTYNMGNFAGAVVSNGSIYTMGIGAANKPWLTVPFKTRMRANPTVTGYAPGSGNSEKCTSSIGELWCRIYEVSEYDWTWYPENGGDLVIGNFAAAQFTFDAEMY